MVCETAEELNARLVLRAMWSPTERGDQQEADNEEEAPGPSQLHRRMRAELNEVLEGSFKRRLARIEKKVAILCDVSNGKAPAAVAPAAAAALPPASKARPSSPASIQTEDPPRTEPLANAMKVAMRRASEASVKPAKVYGPTKLQVRLPDPREEKEDLPVSEVSCLKASFENIGRSLSSRERQIVSLKKQLAHCCELNEEKKIEVAAGIENLRELQDNPVLLPEAQEKRIRQREEHVEELTSNLKKSQQQARHYQSLAQQQRAFFLQGERISTTGGAEALARHPAGEVALVQRPPPMGDEKPEVWDVGTSIANPYVVDSWPFEPNVLANRTSKEATMQPTVEETEEDLEEERRRLPFRAGLGLKLPGRRMDEDDEYDDRYGGPSETSRSL